MPKKETVWLNVQLPTTEEQLALDEVLLDQSHTGHFQGVMVRAWMPTEPAVILGSSSCLEEEVDSQACKDTGTRILRRPSGGATVVIGPGCLMWSVVTHHPLTTPGIKEIHSSILDPLSRALSKRSRHPVIRRGLSDLAIHASEGERKVSGNSLRVRKHSVLYHGTLLDTFDISLISRVLRHPPREPDYRKHRSHQAFLSNLDIGRGTLIDALQEAFEVDHMTTKFPRHEVSQLVKNRYANPSWIYRL
ncbi:MAG: lipoate--protein ligase family protein [Pirellulales bacterium]|nr:lipoate--protein ligase family protein [Pirellulales bacterium]